ncbi:MAG TPA: hypothetical protein VHT50_33930, partial [Mycobacterium sp.]|nr:hypothetical protein [Mycobacterium sp.]
MWATISNSATKMTCAACIAIAATLPAAGSSAERIANENARLAAFTDVDAFSAIPSYLALLGGDLTAVNALDSINGLPALLDLLGGNIDTLFPTDADPGYAALSAIDVFFGDNDGTTGGGVFTGGGIDALANYDALSALPVFFGTDGVFTGGGIDALSGYDALSAIPVFANVANAAAAGNFVSTCTTDTGGDITCTPSVASALGDYAALSAVDTF